MKIIERIIASPGSPSSTNDLWLDISAELPVLKAFVRNQWVDVAAEAYSVPLAPMIVEGTISVHAQEGDLIMFSPAEGAPSWADAHAHMFQGGLVYFILTEDGEPLSASLASIAAEDAIISGFGSDALAWIKPEGSNSEGDDDGSFVAIAVAAGDDWVVYIKSTELSDFVAMNTGVHVYEDDACTVPAEEGYYVFEKDLSDGINEYYSSEGIEDGELPECVTFSTIGGVITAYPSEPV